MYKNFGDVNFFEDGLLIEKDRDTSYNVIVCKPLDCNDDEYLLTRCYIDISDDWINKEAVMKNCGLTSNMKELAKQYEDVPEWYVSDILDYYGPYEFSVDYTDGHIMTANEVLKELENIETDNDVIFNSNI